MQEKYTSNRVIERGYEIYDGWNNNKYKSRKIVNSVQMAVASTNAKKTSSTLLEALAHLFALDLRIKERYDNLLKCIFLYFSWRRETDAFKRFKGMMKLSAGHDIRTLIEVELEKIRENIVEDNAEGDDKKSRGGKVNEFSGEEAEKTESEQQSDAADEPGVEENRDKEIDTEKIEEIGAEKPIEEKNRETTKETLRENLEIEEKTEKESVSVVLEEKEEIKQKNLYEQKAENNGSDEIFEPITDKKQEAVRYNEAADVPCVYKKEKPEVYHAEDSFIDEIIMDNMVKGEKDILGHNPLKDVKQDSVENRVGDVATPTVDKIKNDKDSYLYDKMVANIKGEGAQNKVPITVNIKSDEMRVQISVEDSISMENAFRRAINDQFTVKMIDVHKSLMENALREELIIASEELGIDAPVQIIGEGNNSNVRQSEIISGRKH